LPLDHFISIVGWDAARMNISKLRQGFTISSTESASLLHHSSKILTRTSSPLPLPFGVGMLVTHEISSLLLAECLVMSRPWFA
jgi:hypothetical protein